MCAREELLFTREPDQQLAFFANNTTRCGIMADAHIEFMHDGKERVQAFLDACRRIQEIVTSSEEWKALPDYEFYYE